MISALPSAPPRPRSYVLYPSPVIKDWSAVNRRHTAPVCGPFAPPRLQYLQAHCHTRCAVHGTPGIYVDVGIISLYPSSYATVSTSSASSSFFPPPLQLMMSLILLSLLLLWAHSGACTVIIVVGSYGAVVVGQVERARQAIKTLAVACLQEASYFLCQVPDALASPYLLPL